MVSLGSSLFLQSHQYPVAEAPPADLSYLYTFILIHSSQSVNFEHHSQIKFLFSLYVTMGIELQHELGRGQPCSNRSTVQEQGEAVPAQTIRQRAEREGQRAREMKRIPSGSVLPLLAPALCIQPFDVAKGLLMSTKLMTENLIVKSEKGKPQD